jgi:hypothetical protein
MRVFLYNELFLYCAVLEAGPVDDAAANLDQTTKKAAEAALFCTTSRD